MGVDLTKLAPDLQTKLWQFVAACTDDSMLKAAGMQLVITEGRRPDIVQARYFCHGRTAAEVLAWLDHVKATEAQRGLMVLAMEELYGQPEKYQQAGRAPGRIITNALPCSGPHCLGVAFHARLKQGERVLTDADTPWETLGKISRRCGLIWGGDWTMRDLEHHELPKNLWPKPDTAEQARPQAA